MDLAHGRNSKDISFGGLDQMVTASLRWNLVVDGLALLLQQQHLGFCGTGGVAVVGVLHTLDHSGNP